MQHGRAQKRRHQRIQRAEEPRRLGGGIALRHGLQREAEARTHHGQQSDHAPDAAAARQVGLLFQEGGHKREHTQHPDLDDAERHGVRLPVRAAVGRDDRRGINHRGQHRQTFALSEVERSAAEIDEQHARERRRRAQKRRPVGSAAVQRRLKQRHENNGGVFQRGDDGRVRRVQGGHLAAHDEVEQHPHQSAAPDRSQGDTAQLPEKEHAQQQKSQQKTHRQQIERVQIRQTPFCEDKRRGPRGNHCGEQNFGLFFFHHQALLHRIAGVVYPRFPVPETGVSSISVPDFSYISRSREKTPAGQAAPQVSVRPAA